MKEVKENTPVSIEDKNSHFLLLWKYRLFRPRSAPFVEQPMGVQSVLNRMTRMAVPHPEQVGMQCLIAVKGRGQQVNIIF